MRDILLYYSNIFKGNTYNIHKALINNHDIDYLKIDQLKKQYNDLKINYVTMLDEEYPKILLHYKYPPYVLYYKGDLKLLKQTSLLLISENKTADSYLDLAKDKFDENISLIILDYVPHIKKISESFENPKLIFVKVTPLSFINDWDDKNLYISQYPITTHPKKEYFAEHIKVAAAISDALIIMGSEQKYKTINLANVFLDFDKQVYCFPSNNLDDANNYLLDNGASLVTNFSKIINIKNNPLSQVI
ncbi:DNA-processing protein DprA [Mycoplasmopsis ciconiae]|uniref:DNA-processing protein DprA n=1 Tax=Mycoplasmopsis ciconiae TaxID=561067 RepID=A0ABU7MKK2_9BACT|nr:DNA-processing protein DprA [Mycoplasmopsis ciconiae]